MFCFDRQGLYDVFLLGPEGETGTLVAGEEAGVELYDVTEPVYYVAPDSISEDEVTVQFWAKIHKAGGGIPASVQMKPEEGTSSAGKLKLQSNTVQANAKLMKQM